MFRTIWTFNKFEEIYLLTRGGPGTSTYNLALYAFDQSIANLRMGVGAAAGVIMLHPAARRRGVLHPRLRLRARGPGRMRTWVSSLLYAVL